MSEDITPTLLRIPHDMVKAIEVYWHQRQLPSRSAAIRELLAYALDAKEIATSPAAPRNAKLARSESRR